MCDVKRCRQETTILVLGAGLCDKCYTKHCNGGSLDTHKGILTFEEGKTILKKR